jgi:type IV secretion system protein VirB6
VFGQLGSWLTQFTNGYVARVAGNLSTALAVIALLWVTVYIANYGYAVVRGETQEPMSVFGWKMFKLAIILAFVLPGASYMSVVFATADGLQDGMATIFLGGGQYNQSAPTTVFGALDAANNQANDILKDIWRDASMWRLDLVVASVLFSAGTVIFLVLGAFVTLLSKVILTFALAIGPMSILALMFKPTSKFFDAWLSLVLSAVVLSWFVFFALGLSFFVAQELLRGMQASGAFTASGAVAAVEAAATYLTFMVLLAIVLYQAPHLASQLTGGASIQTGGQMAAAGLAAQRLLGGRGAGASTGTASAGSAGGGSVSRGAGASYYAGRAAGAVGNAGASAMGAVADVGAAGGRAAVSGGRWAFQRVADLGNRKK